MWLIEWLCSLAGTIKVKTMKLFLSGLKSYQLDLGMDCLAFTDSRIERTIQVINQNHNQPERRIRTPLTRPYLLHILCHLPGPDYDNTMLGAALTLAFAGFLPVGEFTYRESDPELGASFSNWNLTKQHIRIPAGESYMQLTILASKTDPFPKRYNTNNPSKWRPSMPRQPHETPPSDWLPPAPLCTTFLYRKTRATCLYTRRRCWKAPTNGQYCRPWSQSLQPA